MKKTLLTVGIVLLVLAGIGGYLYSLTERGVGGSLYIAASGSPTTSGLYASTTNTTATWSNVSSLRFMRAANATTSVYVNTEGAKGLDIRVCSGATTSQPYLSYQLSFSDDTTNNSPSSKVYAPETYYAAGVTVAPAPVFGRINLSTSTNEALPCRNTRVTIQNSAWTKVDLHMPTGASLVWYGIYPQVD